METLGTKLRSYRRRMGLTLDELAGRTGISKPYLSLIETGRQPNPPSDGKLRRLEQTLGFLPGELIGQAHLQRTPRDVRAMLGKLINKKSDGGTERRSDEGKSAVAGGAGSSPSSLSRSVAPSLPTNLDDAYLSGVLQQLVEKAAGNV